MNELSSVKTFRKLAADNLKEHRQRQKDGNTYGAGISWGLYLAYKSAAYRVGQDALMSRILKGTE